MTDSVYVYSTPPSPTFHGELDAGSFTTSVIATSLEHMAEILADTLPNDDPNKPFPVKVEGVGVIAFYSTGTWHEI